MDDVAQAVPIGQHLTGLRAVTRADPQVDRAARADGIAAHGELGRGDHSENGQSQEPGAARHGSKT